MVFVMMALSILVSVIKANGWMMIPTYCVVFCWIGSFLVWCVYSNSKAANGQKSKNEDLPQQTVVLGKTWTMTAKVKLDPGAIFPSRAHSTDAGLDLYATGPMQVPAKGEAVFDTGVHIELPSGTAGMLKSKSGLNVNHSITSEGVIDEGYTGSIRVKLYNHSDCPYQVERGDKISQLVIVPVLTPALDLVDKLADTDRGTGGFGSTGR